MLKKLSRTDALKKISEWSTDDVLCVLEKNGLAEVGNAISKRQIDGDELLHLTEGKLVLWKRDLTSSMIWGLWTFIEEVKREPEKYVEEKIEPHGNEDHLSDTGSWGTDFEDETHEENALPENLTKSSGFRIKQKPTEENKGSNQKDARTDGISWPEDEGTYANCGSPQEDETAYTNCRELNVALTKNVSRLHSQQEKSLAEQLKEQLQLRSNQKPMVGPKPESLQARKITVTPLGRPQKSILHNALQAKPNGPSQTQRRMAVPPPPEPKKVKDQPLITEKSNKGQTKPPAVLRTIDFVANLPTKTEESEDEYEPFDGQIIEQNQKKNMFRVDSKQSLTSSHQSSAESVYQPPSVTSFEEEDEHYEIYESITETPDDNEFNSRPIQRVTNAKAPPPLPGKPPQLASPSQTLNRANSGKPKERSPDKKSATLPHSNIYTSSLERASRPLPPPPERQSTDKQSYVDKPWFHNVTREQATAMIKEQSTYGNTQDGYFLLRPSTTNVNNPLTLVLWYKDRVYNVAVRRRSDNRYALGSAKVNERSFSSVEEIVTFYTKEELMLETGGVQTGSTKLTDTPPKYVPGRSCHEDKREY